MEFEYREARYVGNKKMAVNTKSFVKNMKEHIVSRSFSHLNTYQPCIIFHDFMQKGNDPNCQDSDTGDTFLHILCQDADSRKDAIGTRVVYNLATKIDLDIADFNGDTPLHKIVLVPGTWRWIVAFLRCGACPLIRNNRGRNVEEEILFYKKDGWEENLHWLRKFLPGLWAAVKSKNPDIQLIEKLLKYWCRTTKVIGREAVNLKCLLHMCDTQLDTVCMLEKYENTIEMALSMLSARFAFIDLWKPNEREYDVDVNVKDFSYQYHYQDYPVAPRPLVVAVWETEVAILVERFMKLKPDLNIKYTFESQACSPPKPLFFHLFNPKMRPKDESITAEILRHADLSIRNVYGQTALMEAIINNETEGIIKAILEVGVDLAARDAKGRTARDHCDILGRQDLKTLIDNYILLLIKEKNVQKLDSLILHMYDIQNLKRCRITGRISSLFKCDQAKVKKLLSLVKAGDKYHFLNTINDTYCSSKDRAGRSLLHLAIQYSGATSVKPRCMSGSKDAESNDQSDSIDVTSIHSSTGLISEQAQLLNGQVEQKQPRKCDCYFKQIMTRLHPVPDHIGIIKHLVEHYPFLLNYTNNLGQTPLHYAHIYSASPEVIREVQGASEPTQVKDVFDFLPHDYDQREFGAQTFFVRRRPTFDLDLDIFLKENDFQEKFQNALKSGDVRKVKNLIEPLLEHHGELRFSSVLFDCLDEGHIQLASYLIQSGFKTNIFKQYLACQPDNPMCAMMECNHTVTSLRQRAVEMGISDIVQQIDEIQL